MPVLCFIIHGIGEQSQGYSVPLQEGIHNELYKLGVNPSAVEFKALYWANIGTNEQANLFRKIYPEFFGNRIFFKRIWDTLTKFAPARSLSVNLLGDIFGYLGQFQDPIKRAIYEQMRQALEAEFSRRRRTSIILVGHSLGTVILHDLVAGFLQYNYAGFDALVGHTSVYTMGSPLSLFSLIANRVQTNRFRKWTNILHKRDVVAFPLEKTVGNSVVDVRIWKWFWNPLNQWNPIEIHGAYWKCKMVHKLIATEIAEHEKQSVGISNLPAIGQAPPELFQPLVGGMNLAGLSQTFADFRDVPFKHLIATAREMDFCNIYGGAWLATHSQSFAHTLQRAEVKIRACIMSPDNPGLPGLSQHFSGKSVEHLKQKIEEGMKELISAMEDARKKSNNVGRLTIHRTKNMVNHSFYRFDDIVFFAPRPLASSKNASTPIPCFAFRRTSELGSMYEWVMRDFEELIKSPRDATCDFDSTESAT